MLREATRQRTPEPDDRIGSERRALGIYYTPNHVSAVLCDWAVRKSTDRVLEPSFGGCVFLVEAAAALRERGAQRPFAQLYGCDVDKRAFIHLQNAFPNRDIQSRFVRKDFLQLSLGGHLRSTVDAIVGNPPYISNHNMTEAQRLSARQSAAAGPLDVRITASLWAHFVNHSLTFLADQGRLAMVLPGAAFRTDYGQRLLAQLGRRFRHVDVINLKERVFARQGIDETPSILLCDGWNDADGKRSATMRSAETMQDCGQQILALRSRRSRAPRVADPRNESAMSVFRRLGQFRLGDLATIKIGIVTGANYFFALRPSDIEVLQLPAGATLPFFAHISMSPALEVRQSDLRQAMRLNEKCLLLHPAGHAKDKRLKAYLASFPKDERHSNRTFQKRAQWYQPSEGQVPDAFLSYMNAHSARMVINSAQLQSLNNIHRVYFEPSVDCAQRKLIALTLLSSAGQLAAELLGRRYSGGVLKLEPSDAARLPIPGFARRQTTLIEATWRAVNVALRAVNYEVAVAHADRIVAACAPGIEGDLQVSRELLNSLRADRTINRIN